MLAGGDIPQQILVQGFVARQFGIGWLNTLCDDSVKILMLDKLYPATHHLAHASAVELILEVAVVEKWLYVRVGRLQPQLSYTLCQVEHPQHADPQWRHTMATPVDTLSSERLHE